MITNNEYVDLIQEVLSERDLLEQLVEELSELQQVSIKLIRIKTLNKPNAEFYDLLKNFREEEKDIISILHLLDDNDKYSWIDDYYKYKRWYNRIMEGVKNDLWCGCI